MGWVLLMTFVNGAKGDLSAFVRNPVHYLDDYFTQYDDGVQ